MLLDDVLKSAAIPLSYSTFLAIVVHVVYKKYEPDPTAYLFTFTLLGVIPCISSAIFANHFSSSITAYFAGIFVFYVFLLLSIGTYRLSPWHPLAEYPGPKLAKLSMFWLVRVIQTGKQHLVLKDLHDRYGPLVRIGPNEISVADVDLVSRILGPNGMPKGPYMDGIRVPDTPASLLAARNFPEHAVKRKPWTHAFSAPAVRDFGPTIARRTLQLVEMLESFATAKGNNGKSVNLSTCFSYFAFDSMGDVVFGGGFELMRDGDVEGIWGMVAASMSARRWMGQIPWTARVINRQPAVGKAVSKLHDYTMKCIARRKERGTIVKDLFYHITNEDGDGQTPNPISFIMESCEVAIIAGSDTTSTTLSGLFYYLLANPELYKRLQKEIDGVFPPGEGDALDLTKLSELPFLNAAINETLRIQPAVQTLQRAPLIGSGGKWLGDRFIPEGTSVTVQPYTLHRNPQYFSPSPDKFWPDRWLQSSTNEKIVMTPAVFIPFSIGPANCVGKGLAFAEMRMVVAVFMQRFEMRFADGYDHKRWEAELEDMFVFKVGKLPVVLELRT